MRRILIVEASDVLAQLFKETCFSEDIVRICTDGYTALELLEAFRPEILLLNLTLPYKTGWEVLLEATYLPRQTVVFSYLSNPYISYGLGCLGVQHVLHMPTPDSIRQALLWMENNQTGVRADLRQQVTAHLQRLGIPKDLEGYQILSVALPLLVRTPDQALGKELYPAVVCALGKGNEKTVEHSLREAVTQGWKHRSDIIWAEYFARNGNGQIRCPTNKQFLMAVLSRLQKDMGLQEQIQRKIDRHGR